MYSNEKLLEMLTSAKSSERYEACIRLQTAKESSPEIITALEKATHDEYSNVAERATLALQSDVHHQMAIKISGSEIDKEIENPQQENKISMVESTGRKRSGCLTAFLILLLIVNNPLAGLYFMFRRSEMNIVLPYMPEWRIQMLGVLTLAWFGFTIGIWKWKKWGMYGLVGLIFVNFLGNVISTGNLVVGIIDSLIVLIVFIILTFLVRPVWKQMV
jgi:hypothetical protein